MNKNLKGCVFFLLLTFIWGTALASGPSDPCGLLTKEEAEALVGEPVNGPEQKDTKNPLGQKMCLYETVSSSRLIQISVVRTTDMAPRIRKNGQSAAKVYHTTREMLDPVAQVPGVGDVCLLGHPRLAHPQR